MNKGNFKLNLIISVVNVIVSTAQSLWFVQFITRTMGSEAYGYIAVVTNIVNMSTIISLALTSMSTRYITIELQRNNKEKANEYISSILMSLICASVLIIVIFVPVIANINLFMNVSVNYVNQVRILFVVSIASLIITLISTPFISSFFYTNKLYIMYMFSTLNYINRIVFSIILFTKYKPVIWGVYLGGLIIDVISLVYYLIYYKKQIPSTKISVNLCKFEYVIIIIKSGIWMSLSKLGSTLLSTINVYLANILVGVMMSGVYASIYQLQSLIAVVTVAIVNCFIPEMYKIYAESDKMKLVKYTNNSIKFLNIPLGILVGGVIVFGKYFMALWLDESFLNYEMIIILSMIYIPVSFPIEVLNQLLIILNKVKVPAIITIVSGLCNILLIYILCKGFKLGVYGIAISQIVILGIRAVVFFPIYSAHSLKISFSSFYPAIFNCILITFITLIIGIIVRFIWLPTNWLKLIIDAMLTGICSFAISLIINKEMQAKIKIIYFKVLKKGASSI